MSSGMTAIIDTLNQANRIVERRPRWRVWLTAVALTVTLTAVTSIAFGRGLPARCGHPSVCGRRPRPDPHADRRRQHRAVSSSTNMLGWDAGGGGVMGYFSDHVGLRGDMRYLRATSDLSTGVSSLDLGGNRLHFWRASIGVVIR
jgi:hypothetical protein